MTPDESVPVLDWKNLSPVFMQALAARNFDALAQCFHPHVRGRLLTPSALAMPGGRETLTSRYRAWFGEADHLELVSSSCDLLGTRVAIGYRLRLRRTARRARASFVSMFGKSPIEAKEEDMIATLMIHATHAKDDAERATLAFIVANVAASAEQQVVVLLTVEGVWLATRGYADGIHKEGFQPLADVMRALMDNGGQIWACGKCTKPRGIGEADLIPGARIVTAANVVECLAGGAASLSFC